MGRIAENAFGKLFGGVLGVRARSWAGSDTGQGGLGEEPEEHWCVASMSCVVLQCHELP